MVIGLVQKLNLQWDGGFTQFTFKIGFIKELVEYNHTRDPKIKDEKAILKIVQNYLKMQKSKARVKFDRDKPTLGGYWHWLLR